MSEEPPTLQEIAREIGQMGQSAVSEAEITGALQRAGSDPRDENERERFRRLVHASVEFQRQEIAASLSPWYERAADELGPEADEYQIVKRALELWDAAE